MYKSAEIKNDGKKAVFSRIMQKITTGKFH